MYCIVKTFGSKEVWRIRTVGSLAEKNGELKSTCIGYVMEIVKIGEKTWRNGVIHQIYQSCNHLCFLLYGTYNAKLRINYV